MNIWIYGPAKFFSTWISMVSVFKKHKNRIRIISWHWYLIIKNVLEVEYAMKSIDIHQQTINIWEIIKKTKDHYLVCIGMQTTYTDEQCFKNYLQTILNERKNTSKLDEKFMKNNDENSSLVCNLYDKEKYVIRALKSKH